MTKMSADVVIVGGGIIGCATAYYLAKQGVTDVVVVERDFLAAVPLAVAAPACVSSGAPK